METSIFLARIIGPLFVLVGVGFLLNTKHYCQMTANFLRNAELYYFSGAIAFVTGIALVTFHNIWVADWRVIITIIGWMSVLKGSLRILFPKFGAEAADTFVQSGTALKFGAVPLLVIGAWLSYQGFLT